MDRKQLRIGNAICYECTIHIVYELHTDKVLHFWRGVDPHFSRYESIEGFPLDDERLRKLGFEHLEKGPYRDQDACVLGTDANRIVYSAKKIFKPLEDGFLIIAENITDIHQLQNIYFMMRGEELDIENIY